MNPEVPRARGGGIHGVGIDLVEVERVQRLLQRLGARARRRLFHPEELAQAGNGRQALVRLAGRLAAKEAVYKALSPGLPLRWREIAVVRGPGGRPEVRLFGTTQAAAAAAGVAVVHLSLSHERSVAVACAVAVRR